MIEGNGTNSETGKFYLYTQAPALMSFRESQTAIPQEVMVYDTAVALAVSTEGTDTIYEGTSEDLIFRIVLHEDGSLDYRQAAKVQVIFDGENRTNIAVSVVEGVNMEVDDEGNIAGGFQSWNIMQIDDNPPAESAMFGELRSKGSLYAVANLTMKSRLQKDKSMPSVKDAFVYSITDLTEGMVTIGHPYQLGWTDGSTFGSFEYNNSVTGGEVPPPDEEKCEELNEKIQEIFKDSKWQIDFIEDSGTVSPPVEALPQA